MGPAPAFIVGPTVGPLDNIFGVRVKRQYISFIPTITGNKTALHRLDVQQY